MPDPQTFSLVSSQDDRRIDAAGVSAIAASLADRTGDERHATVAMAIADKFTLIAVMLAASQLNLRIVPLDPATPPDVRGRLLAASDAKFLVTDDLTGDRVSPAPLLDAKSLLRPRDEVLPAADFTRILASWLFYTSGSTGTPKGIEITADMLRANVELALRHLPYEPGFRTASLLPAFHTFTLVNDVMTAFAVSGRCVVMPDFDMARLCHITEALVRHKVNTFSGVPVIFEVMARFGSVLSQGELRFATSGAAPLSGRLGRLYLENTGHALVPCYGMTEGVCFLSISEPQSIKFGSAGRPVVDMRIVDGNDRPVGNGVIGGIQVRGASVMAAGYFKSAMPLRDVYAEGGWLRTGDLGFLDEDGILTITGRTKNMIIRGGEKVYLEDVEALFEAGTVAGVGDGGADRERFALFFENERYQEAEVVERIRNALGPGHLPDRTIPIKTVPKSLTGKLQRKVLVEWLQHGHR